MDKAYSNIVKKKEMREIQGWTLRKLKDLLIPSAGCYGSVTMIMEGDPENPGTLRSTYSKDGHTILSSSRFNRAMEESIRTQCVDMTRYIVKEVGDGTTSTIILASLIFDAITEVIGDSYPPYRIVEEFKNVVAELQNIIKLHRRELTLDDVYKIAMISTNNDIHASKTLEDIYKKYGFDVFIDVAASVSDHDVIRSYDGLTLGVGYSDPCYVNTMPKKLTDDDAGTCVINDARVYAFKDPIDTVEMSQFFNQIVKTNILDPMNRYLTTRDKKAFDAIKPTVIMAPKISIDMNRSFQAIAEFMYQFNNDLSMKPPLLIITNIGVTNEATYTDIWQLCGCRVIKKYIDPEIQEKDQEAGEAPTMETIVDEFYGEAKSVKADAFKTTFIDPKGMFDYDEDGEIKEDEEGNPVYSNSYAGQVAFLEQELKVAIDNNETIDTIGNLRRRIHSLKANMVDYFVGGISMSDRDATRDLVEDAVKNIRSAAVDGVGYGTNFEGWRACIELLNNYKMEENVPQLRRDILDAIHSAYDKITEILYNTVDYSDSNILAAKDAMAASIIEDCPMNFTTKKFDGSVLCTIKQDIAILDVMSKIVSLMFTTNQALTNGVQYNFYIAEEDQ